MTDDLLRVIECRGDPRAMGEAQGRALRESIRACVQRAGAGPSGRSPYSLRSFTNGRVLGRGMGRGIARHYPHLSERIQGLARGADLPIAALMHAFVTEASHPRAIDSPTAEAAAVVRREGEQARLTRRLWKRGHRWVLRRSEPAVGFRSVEVTLPWLATAVAGVNEAGVAAMLAPRATSGASIDSPGAALLVQECLQRFESLEACIDWILKRPASGWLSIALSDAKGEAAVVDIAGTERNVSHLPEGLTAAGGDEESHAALLASGTAEVDWPKPNGEPPHLIVCAEPARRRLRILARPEGTEAVFGPAGTTDSA